MPLKRFNESNHDTPLKKPVNIVEENVEVSHPVGNFAATQVLPLISVDILAGPTTGDLRSELAKRIEADKVKFGRNPLLMLEE